jgi:hypothetical protein
VCLRGTGLVEWRSCEPVDCWSGRPEGRGPSGGLVGLQMECQPDGLWSASLMGAEEQAKGIGNPMDYGAVTLQAYGAGLSMQHWLFC